MWVFHICRGGIWGKTVRFSTGKSEESRISRVFFGGFSTFSTEKPVENFLLHFKKL